MRNRSIARKLALQFLYTLDLRGDDALPELDDFLREHGDKEEIRAFAKRLILNVHEHLDAVDRKISEVALNWRMERMAIIDRNILRMAVCELLYNDDIPPVVSINEAIELAKEFSTEKSSSFVNGILDKINIQHAAQTPAGPVPEAPRPPKKTKQ